MAAAQDKVTVLSSTREKANFQRVARLLISGGTSLIRETFDGLCPPSYLLKILKTRATKEQLSLANLTKPQWDRLYPSPGVYGKSADFDVTLLFRLLRTICSLTPPATGWDARPEREDHSLAADLVRIKYYRNSVYGHVSQNMEITDDKFPQLWQDISEALLRIAKQIGSRKKRAWQKAIDNFLTDPLTAEDERNVQELLRWYKNDVEVKEFIESSAQKTRKRMKSLRRSFREEAQDIRDHLGGELETTGQEVQSVVREEAQDIKDHLGEELKTTSQDVQGLVREEAQDIRDQLEGELKTTSQDVQSLVREEAQDIKDQLEGDLKTTSQDVQNLVREEAQDIKDQLEGELKTTSQDVQNLVREEAQDIKDQLGEMHQSIDRLSSSAGTSQAAGGE